MRSRRHRRSRSKPRNAPGRISTLVYLTAILPQNGETTLELTRGQNSPGQTAKMALHPPPDGATLTAANFGAVPRTYIECLRDRILPLPLQRAMHTAFPCRSVYAIDTDHSPFYSAPETTAAHLLQIAATFA